jgi:hypothetical protein
VHEWAETLVVAGAERFAVAFDQCLRSGGVAGLDELENGRDRDY